MYRLVQVASEEGEEVEVIPVSWLNEDKAVCMYQPTVKSPSTVTQYVRKVVAPKEIGVPYYVAVKKPYDFGAISDGTNILETSHCQSAPKRTRVEFVNWEDISEEMCAGEQLSDASRHPEVILKQTVLSHENKPIAGGSKTMEKSERRVICKKKVDNFINWDDLTEEMLRNEDLDVPSPKHPEVVSVKQTISSVVNKPASSSTQSANQHHTENSSVPSSSASCSSENTNNLCNENSSTTPPSGHTSNCCPCHKASIK